MTDETVSQRPSRYERRGDAAWITMSAPQTRNALSAEMVASLRSHVDQAWRDPHVRAVVLTGEGPAFCAGADLRAGGRMGEEESNRNPFIELLRGLRDGPKPVLAAVNGHAFGGGIGLVAAADIAIAVQEARFAFSEVRVGVVPAMISVVVLPKIGLHHASRLFLTGRRFTAEEARAFGLVHEVVAAENLEKAVEAEVAEVAKGGPNAVREAKRLIRTIARLPEDEAFAYAERKIADLFASDEAREGMQAFLEKRRPCWAPRREEA